MVFGLNILYVTYSNEKRVVGIDISGTIVLDFTFEQFVFLTGIAFDRQNNKILVAEHGGIGEDMERPGGCSICWSSYGPQTAIYVFDLNGNHENTFGYFGNDDGQFQRIQGITVGTCGNIYATDPYLGRVSVFDPDGNFITKFGAHGNALGEFNLPTGIVFSSDNRAFISSLNKGSIDVFSISSLLPTATITSIDNAICNGTTTDITVEFTGVGPWDFTYTLDDLNPVQLTANETPFSFPVDVEGLYKIEALTDSTGAIGTCFTGSTAVTVSSEIPTATMITTELIKCGGDDTGIELEFTGLAPWTFTYTIDGVNPTEIIATQSPFVLSVDQSGLYEFFDLSDDACVGDPIIGSATVSINPLPLATVDPNSHTIEILQGETAAIDISFTGSAPYTFDYTINGENLTSITTSDNPYTLSVSAEGNYEIISIADLYCTNDNWQDYFDVFMYATPTATIETSDFYLCPGETAALSIDFTGEAPWTFSYTIDGVNPETISTSSNPYFLTGTLPGIYELTAVSDQNTTGTVSGAANVILFDELIVNLPEDFYLCEGEQYILDAGEYDSYLWSDGSTNRTLAVSSTGIYSVTVTSISGCTGSDEVSVTVFSLPEANFYMDVNSLEIQFVSDALNADSHYWDFGDGTSATAENPIHLFPQPGFYTITYTALSDHCGSSVYSRDIFISNRPEGEVVDIFPNPSNGDFTVALSTNEPVVGSIEILIHSMTGNPIYSGSFDPNFVPIFEGTLFIDIHLGNFTNGLYIVTVNTSNFVEQHQLLLHH
jgi:hypothetical protein